MKIKVGLWVIGVVAMFMIPSLCYSMGFEVGVGGWQQDPSGTLGYKALSTDDIIDLETDAGYDKETRPVARLIIDMPLVFPNIYLMYTPLEFEGTGSKSADFTFGDETISANVPFYSKLKIDHYDIALFYGLPFLETATLDKLNVDLGLNFRVLDLEARVRQDATSVDESTSETVLVPMVFAAVQLRPLEWLGMEVEGRGIAYSNSHYYDVVARVRFKVFGPLGIAAGWRLEDLEIDEDDVIAEIEFSGPFAEVGFTF